MENAFSTQKPASNSRLIVHNIMLHNLRMHLQSVHMHEYRCNSPSRLYIASLYFQQVQRHSGYALQTL